MAELPSIPGYEVESLVAQGPRTEVWRARHRRTGRLVAVKRPRPGIGRSRSVVARLEHEARVLAAVSHEHVVGLVAGMRGSWWRGRAPTVLVTEYAAGGSLAQLLDRRGRLSPGEVITLGVALVRAVEGLVSRGFVHGRIHPEHVVFSEIGKPLLVGFGSATTSPPAPVGGSSDLADVARLLVLALTGGPPVPGTSVATLAPATPPGLVDVLDRWLTLPPERLRPDGLAAELLRAYPAAPIQLGTAATTAGGPSPAGPPPPSKARSPGEAGEEEAVASSQAAVTRRPDVRRFVWPAAVGFAAVAVAAVSVGGLLGWSLPGGRPAQADRPLAAWQSSQVPSSGGRVVAILPSESGVPSPLSAAAGPTPPDGRAQAAASTIAWRDVLDRLYALRARAFTDLDADALARVYVPGSALRAADEATIRALQASGSRPEGLGWRLESVQVRAERPAAVTLFVVDQRRAYSVVGPDGTRTTYPAQTSSRTIDLRLVDGEWRIEAIGSP